MGLVVFSLGLVGNRRFEREVRELSLEKRAEFKYVEKRNLRIFFFKKRKNIRLEVVKRRVGISNFEWLCLVVGYCLERRVEGGEGGGKDGRGF